MSTAEAVYDIAPILREMRWRTGVDFSRYRPATVRRRIHNRMIAVGAGTVQDYLGLLHSSSEEASHLLARLAIKVSRFYRHAPAWRALSTVMVPELRSLDRPIRAWSAGCGYGEEAYSLAILLENAGLAGTVQATDIDSAAIVVAQAARFARSAIADVPAPFTTQYLLPVHGEPDLVEVAPEVRDRVRFSRHDIIFAAAPSEAFDLVSCRNVIIYFRPDARDEALATLIRAVRPGGYLLLGEAEWPSPPFQPALEAVAPQGKLFRKIGKT